MSQARVVYLASRAEGDPTDWARDFAVEKTYDKVLKLWDDLGKYQTVNRHIGGVTKPYFADDAYRKRRWASRIDGAVPAWETDFLGQQNANTAAKAFEAELAKLQLLTDQAKKLLDKAVAIYSKAPTTGNAQSYSICYKSWIDASERLATHLGTRVERTSWDAKRGAFEKAREKAFRAIYKDYHGKGEAYRLLCHRAASAWATLQQLEDQGVLPGSTEHGKVNAEFLALIAQIQKYTESLKSEIQETRLHEFGERILKIVERHLMNQPLVFKRILTEVEGDEPIDVPLLHAG